MINSYFKEISPFCYNYFSTLLSAVDDNIRQFPQAIIFEGMDTKLQFLFTLELAIALNSKNQNSDTNKKWIKSHSHPAITYVSQIHNKPDDDSSKTVKSIELSLNTTSDYHRFFIFFSSKEYTYNDNELKDFEDLGYSTDINFSIEPLEYKTFNDRALNILLKCTEEPPNNTTFVFLTNSKENILPTIASRCQIFKFTNHMARQNKFHINNLFNFYPEINYSNAYELSEILLNYTKNNQIDTLDLLSEFISYIKNLIISNQDSYNRILTDVKIINQASKMIKANVSEKNTLETMFIRLARGY